MNELAVDQEEFAAALANLINASVWVGTLRERFNTGRASQEERLQAMVEEIAALNGLFVAVTGRQMTLDEMARLAELGTSKP